MLANIMQQNCTVKKSDILAVLAELAEVMQQQLQNSKRVKLDGLGTFKIGIRTKAADSPKDFNVQKNVVNTHILFRPETRINKNKSRMRALQELPENKVDKAKKSEPGH